jgi:LPXTG-motif cell wall-anchored protein
MTGNTLYIVIGVTILAVLGGAVAWVRRRRDPQSGEGNKIHPLLLLGIVFLIPGLMNLIQDGELSGFLNLGIIFTLSGLAAQVLIKNQADPEVRKVILLSSLAGLLLGGMSGAVISMIVGWPFPLTIVLFCTLGLLLGMLFSRLYLRSNQI